MLVSQRRVGDRMGKEAESTEGVRSCCSEVRFSFPFLRKQNARDNRGALGAATREPLDDYCEC